eukprot:1054862-Alexandrium_andersonii.AAC.1
MRAAVAGGSAPLRLVVLPPAARPGPPPVYTRPLALREVALPGALRRVAKRGRFRLPHGLCYTAALGSRVGRHFRRPASWR